MIYGYIKGKSSPFHTYAETLYRWTWMGFMIAAIVPFIIISDRIESVAPFIITLAGIPTFISVFIIKFRPLIFGGIALRISALIARFWGNEISAFAVSLALFTGYLLPGYMLKRKVDHENV
ncbi:MAG TPA: hypothetical protein PKL65_01910 [Bacteroidales bacterium]|nr:hypothetical protein [Bacteroidales bacterium]HNR40961.1 hypothetical protein [Bacteroidales bacterium]HPM19028.1 hypothetical protein [Bacteroidales bacterium]